MRLIRLPRNTTNTRYGSKGQLTDRGSLSTTGISGGRSLGTIGRALSPAVGNSVKYSRRPRTHQSKGGSSSIGVTAPTGRPYAPKGGRSRATSASAARNIPKTSHYASADIRPKARPSFNEGRTVATRPRARPEFNGSPMPRPAPNAAPETPAVRPTPRTAKMVARSNRHVPLASVAPPVPRPVTSNARELRRAAAAARAIARSRKEGLR